MMGGMSHPSWRLVLRSIEKKDLPEATRIWNEAVAAGNCFPNEKILTPEEAWALFENQTQTVCAILDGQVAGLYILHPNNIGRCSHIANASYVVCSKHRGEGIGRALVCDSLERAKRLGFTGLQFNAVSVENTAAIALYLKLGFQIVGTIPGGFRHKDGNFRDTLIFIKKFSQE